MPYVRTGLSGVAGHADSCACYACDSLRGVGDFDPMKMLTDTVENVTKGVEEFGKGVDAIMKGKQQVDRLTAPKQEAGGKRSATDVNRAIQSALARPRQSQSGSPLSAEKSILPTLGMIGAAGVLFWMVSRSL